MYAPLPMTRMVVSLPWGTVMSSRNVVEVVMMVEMEMVWRWTWWWG